MSYTNPIESEQMDIEILIRDTREHLDAKVSATLNLYNTKKA